MLVAGQEEVETRDSGVSAVVDAGDGEEREERGGQGCCWCC